MDDRKYGFKHIKQQYRWMSPGWIENIVGIEPDENVVMHLSSAII